MDKRNRNIKGFTLMEMLIVVAIIAVLVAISIPVFTNHLEKAREATDAANIRSAYAEIMVKATTEESYDSKTVALNQKVDRWQSSIYFPATVIGEPAANGSAEVYFDNTNQRAVIKFTSSKGYISYATQGLYDDTFYIAETGVSKGDVWENVDKSKVKKIVFQSGSSLNGGDAKGFFKDFENLEEIDMSNVDLRSVDYNTFSNTPKLKKITLANLPSADVGYNFYGTWYYDETCTNKLNSIKDGYSRITPKDNGKTLYRKVS